MWSRTTGLSLCAAGFAFSVGLLSKGADPPPPSALFDAPAPFARILNIVVDGEDKTEAVLLEQVKVIRAENDPTATPMPQPGQAGIDLFPMDVVVTGPNINVTIVFLPDPNTTEQLIEEYREVVLDENTSISISNPERNKVRLYFGRFVASVRGWFNSTAGSGYAQVQQTEFEFKINKEGKVELLVLEGLVSLKKADFDEPPPAGEVSSSGYWSNWQNFRVVKNQITDARRVVEITNPCQQPRSYRIALTPNFSWVNIEPKPNSSLLTREESVVTVEPGVAVRVPVLVGLDATGQAVGPYKGELAIKCVDCDLACNPVFSWPFDVEVLEANEVQVPEGDEVKFEKAEALPSPFPAPLQRKLEAVELPVKAFEVTRLRKTPYVATEGTIPAFNSTKDRDSAFRKNRIDAVLKTDRTEKAAAYETLGDVFRSVGENEKADKAYVKVEEYNPDRKKSLEFAIKRLDALRVLGKSSSFTETFNRVAQEADSSHAQKSRLFTLAHISVGTAKLEQALNALKKGDKEAVLGPAIDAERYFKHVLINERANLSQLSKQERSVFWTNYGMALQLLGTYWLGEDKLESALKNYEEAKTALEKARGSDPSNPYIGSNLSLVFTGLGNVEKNKTDPDSRKMLNFYRKSQRELDGLSPNLEEAQTARVLLEASRGETIKARPNIHFTTREATRGGVVPNVEGRLKEVAAELIAKAGFIPDFVNEATGPRRKARQCVGRQFPRAGSWAKRGEQMQVWLRDCPAVLGSQPVTSLTARSPRTSR